MPTKVPDDVKVTLPESLEPVPPPLHASTTNRPVTDDVRRTIASVSYAALVDDLVIALEVRRRDSLDRGERISLEDAMRHYGFEASEFGLE